MKVDVRKVRRLRRRLQLRSIDELLAEARRLAAHAAQHGEYQVCVADWPPRRPGLAYLANLNLGQTLEHLALWVDASLDGARFTGPPPFIRALLRLVRGRMMRSALLLGFILPPDAEALFIPPPETGSAAALAHLEAACARLRSTDRRAPSLVFGELTPAEWDLMHQRHAELHFGYMHAVS